MEANSKQIKTIKEIQGLMQYWEATSDINANYHRSMIMERLELVKLGEEEYLSDYVIDEVTEGLLQVLSAIRTIK